MTAKTVSMLCVTYNRANIVCHAIRDNFATLDGAPVVEMVWVDSGSCDDDYERMQTMFRYVAKAHNVGLVECRLNANRGAAWSQNRAIALASGEAYLITDCDMTFPSGALRDAAEVLFAKPERMSVSIYHVMPDPKATPERFTGADNVTPWGDEWTEPLPSGREVTLKPGLAMVSKMFKREAVEVAGFVSERFGKAEHDDCEFAYRLRARCAERGLQTLVMMGVRSTHLPDVLAAHPRDIEGEAYWAAKEAEFRSPEKAKTMLELAGKNWPRFDPYP